MKLSEDFVNSAERCYLKITDEITQKNTKSTSDKILMMMTKNYIERVKTILILSKEEREESISVLTRVLIELYVSIIHINKDKTAKLAQSYEYNYMVQTIRTALKSSNQKDINLTPDELTMLQEDLPHINSYDEYYKYYEKKWLDLFDKTYKCPKEYRRKWYSLDGKITSFSQLMQSVGIEKKVCDFYYGLMSIDTHAMSAIGKLKDNTITFGSMNSYFCYIMIDMNLSNLVHKLGERYYLLEDEEYLGFIKEMIDTSISIEI